MTKTITIKPEDNFIRDGVTQEGYISESPGMWGAEEFTFRPMLGQVAEEAEQKTTKYLDRNDYQLAYITRCQYVLDHLVSWNRPDEITLQNVLRLRRQVLLRMYEIICGNIRSESRPTTAPTLPEDQADETLGKLVVSTGSGSLTP